MCGIFGYFSRDRSDISPRRIAQMGESIRHRGPDHQGTHRREGMVIGNQRLSIIDLAGGNQPFVSDCGQIAVVQNGEIFNYRELAQELARIGSPCRTQSDTEVLLRLYETEGIEFLNRLNGMFAIAIWDERSQILHLARDRIGIKPLYVHDDGMRLSFGSEIKALLPAVRHQPRPSFDAIHHFLTYNYVPAPLTMYSGVEHLLPGHRMEVALNGARSTRWWNLADQQPVHGRSEGEWIEELNTLLDDAVKLRMRSDVPFGAFLSGGVDSSTIVGLMGRHSREPTKTFCIGFADPKFDESPYAQAAASRFGTNHKAEIVNPDMLGFWREATRVCDQPHGDVSFLPTHRVAQLAAEHVTVVLTGDGGDELFAGYDKYKSFFAGDFYRQASDAVFRKSYFDSISLFTAKAKQTLYSPDGARLAADRESLALATPWLDEAVHFDRINQALYLDMQMLLVGNNLVKPDRMGMAVSLEARAPFLDYRIMELAFRMPGALKLKDGETKYILKKAASDLIGPELAYRKKQMFTVPIGEWFRSHLRNYCQDHLDSLLEKTNYFERKPIQQLLDDHISGNANRTRELRALIALDHWFSNYEGQAD